MSKQIVEGHAKAFEVIALVLGLWPMFRITHTGNELGQGLMARCMAV